MWKLWYVFISLFSLFFSAYSKKWTTDRERCAKVRCNRGRRERRVFKSSRYTRLWSSRASFSRCSMDDDDDDGFVRNSKFRAENKTAAPCE